jgi:hypothetical protein
MAEGDDGEGRRGKDSHGRNRGRHSEVSRLSSEMPCTEFLRVERELICDRFFGKTRELSSRPLTAGAVDAG